MLAGFVGLCTQNMHKSIIATASHFQCDYDANIIALNKDTITVTEPRDMALTLTKAREAQCYSGCKTAGWRANALSWHRPANVITWIMHDPLCPNIINRCKSIPHTLVHHGLKLFLIWLQSGQETISHICMLKLIERDVGDKGGEQRELFATSFHLTGIIRYMKLKFHIRGSCWQHCILLCSSSPLSFVFLFMLIWTQCFVLFFLNCKKATFCLMKGPTLSFTARNQPI